MKASLAGHAGSGYAGCDGTGKSLTVAALLQARALEGAAPQVHFILTPSQERAETLFADLSALLGGEESAPSVLLCPSLESLLFEETSPDYQLVRERLTVLARLADGEALVVIATPDAALHRTLAPEVLRTQQRVLHHHGGNQPGRSGAWLTSAGYRREAMVEQPGQFSMRGGVLDIFPSTENGPVRLEFFGDEIDSLRPFDPASQRSFGALPEVRLSPAREVLLSPERLATALPDIRAALQARLGEVSHTPIRLPGEDGRTGRLALPGGPAVRQNRQ